ncbi:hypothetical protein MNBD_BACTEROID03-2036 [hydrothermal vent metagenome]|uniref:Uncharacterized protein n=1 Tax=hydrothermal vent metagenome TaxID=652676 RepID=A0A3B0TMX6_9ZZZZ
MNKGDVITNPKESFYRRVYRKDKRYIDKRTGRFLSRAFTPRPKDNGFLSVDMKRLTTLESAISNDPTKFLLGVILNEDVIDLGLKSIYDPKTLGEDGFENNAHCLIGQIDKGDESIAGILARKAKKIEID